MRVVKNYIYNLTYQIFVMIVPLITVPYISRVLGANGVGLNAYSNSIMSYFVLLANLGLLTYGNRSIAYCRDSIEERSKCFWEIVILQGLAMLFSFLCLFLFINIYNEYRFLLILQSIQIFATGIDISWFFTGMEDFKKTISRNVLVKFFSIAMIFLMVNNKNDLNKYIVIVSASTLLGNLTLWSYLKKYIVRIEWKQIELNKHIKPIFLLFLPQITTSIFVSVNRIMLGNLSTISQTGFFDNADKIVRIFVSLIAAVGVVMFPRMANYFYKGNNDQVLYYLKNAFDIVNLISFPVAVGVAMVSKPFSSIFFGENFLGIDKVLTISIIGLIFMGWSSILGQQFLVAINQVKGLTISMIISLIVTIFLGILLIPILGAVGAAIGATVGEAVTAIVQCIYINKIVGLKSLFSDVWKYLISSLLMALGCFFIRDLVDSNIYKILLQGIVGMLIYVILLIILRPTIIKESINFKSKLKINK